MSRDGVEVYIAQHRESIEHALREAFIEAAVAREPDPIQAIGRQLLGQRAALAVANVPAPAPPLSAPAAADHHWTLSGWLASLNITNELADVMLSDATDDGGDELTRVRMLLGAIIGASSDTSAHLDALADILERRDSTGRCGLANKLATRLLPALQALSSAQQDADGLREMHARFVMDGISFSFASIADHYRGLEAKIGAPDPRVLIGMEREHLREADSQDEFTTDNYVLTTTPETEYSFVAYPSDSPPAGLAQWPVETRGVAPPEMRRPMAIDELRRRLDDVNRLLEGIDSSPLLLVEAFGGRLYTGPMYAKYNDLLRGFGKALAGCKSNKYVSTTHAINSCIIKTSKLTRASSLYRGVAGRGLPLHFFEPNAQGVRGGVECAFLSATTNRAVALSYAERQAGPRVLFELKQGMVDRGADVQWLSQYPFENEILLPPLTAIEVHGTRVDQGALVVQASLRVSVVSETVEQVVLKRRRMLERLEDAVRLEVREALTTDDATIENLEAAAAVVAAAPAAAAALASDDDAAEGNDVESNASAERMDADERLRARFRAWGWTAAHLEDVVWRASLASHLVKARVGRLDDLARRGALDTAQDEFNDDERFVGTLEYAVQVKSLVAEGSPSQLTLSGCAIGDVGARALAAALPGCVSLRELSLRDCAIGARGLVVLAEALPSSRIVSLDLAADDVALDLSAARSNQLCYETSDGGDYFTEVGMVALASALAASCVEVLSLSGSTLQRTYSPSRRDLQSIAALDGAGPPPGYIVHERAGGRRPLTVANRQEGLPETLTCVDLAAVEAFCSALEQPGNKLRRLEVARCDLGDEAAERMARAIKHARCGLLRLNVNENAISEEGQAALGKAASTLQLQLDLELS